MSTGEAKLTKTIAFRATSAMREQIESHRLARKLHKFSDAARELMEAGVGAGELGQLAAELRALGGDPEVALKDAIAGLVRSDLTAPRDCFSGSQLSALNSQLFSTP